MPAESESMLWQLRDLFPEHPVLLCAVVMILGLAGVPMSPLWTLLGYRLGLIPGLLVAWPGAVIAAAIQFGLMRMLGSRLSGWGAMLKRQQVPGRVLWKMRADGPGLVLARLTWALPFVAVNAWAAASKMPTLKFLGITTLAIFPNILGLVGLGAAIQKVGQAASSPAEQGLWAGLGLIGSLSGVGLMGWFSSRWVRWPAKSSAKS